MERRGGKHKEGEKSSRGNEESEERERCGRWPTCGAVLDILALSRSASCHSWSSLGFRMLAYPSI